MSLLESFLMGTLNKYLLRQVEVKLILSGNKRLAEFLRSLQKMHYNTLL